MSSLLDNPRHEVYVTPASRSRGPYSEDVVYRSEDRVGPIRCSVQPYTAGQNNVSGVKIHKLGVQVKVGYNLFYKGDVWPGGAASLIEWQGRRFLQDGPAQLFDMSASTRHFEVTMIEENPEYR